MKDLIKNLLLVALLIMHSSWGHVMATQMQTFSHNSDSPNISLSKTQSMVKSIDGDMNALCLHHGQSKTSTTQYNSQSDGNCCSDCNCVNVLSSVPTPLHAIGHTFMDSSHQLALITTFFPDSPITSILRPPIS